MLRLHYSTIFILTMIFSSNVFCKTQKNSTNYHQLLDSPIVISLERHRFRFNETKKLMEDVGFSNIQIFNAIDGFYTDDTFFNELNILKGNSGQKGCAASHLIIWREFSQDLGGKNYLFVCEDDMLPHSQFKFLFPFYWSKTPDDFDIVMVGNFLKNLDKSQLQQTCYLKSEPTYTTHAYIISKKGAKKLYNLYMNLPSESDLNTYIIDGFLKQAMINKQLKFYCYDGRFYPDLINMKNNKIWNLGNTGICFQNSELGSSIFSIENLSTDENMYITIFPQN